MAYKTFTPKASDAQRAARVFRDANGEDFAVQHPDYGDAYDYKAICDELLACIADLGLIQNIRVYNNSGSVFTPGMLVKPDGYVHGVLSVSPAYQSGLAYFVVKEAIEAGAIGTVYAAAIVTGLDTSGAPPANVYLGVGTWTLTRPTSPTLIRQEVGTVITIDAVNGSIFFYPGLSFVSQWPSGLLPSTVTLMSNTFNGASQLVETDGSGKISTAGIVADAALSANVPLLNAANTFTSGNQFGAISLSGGTNWKWYAAAKPTTRPVCLGSAALVDGDVWNDGTEDWISKTVGGTQYWLSVQTHTWFWNGGGGNYGGSTVNYFGTLRYTGPGADGHVMVTRASIKAQIGVNNQTNYFTLQAQMLDGTSYGNTASTKPASGDNSAVWTQYTWSGGTVVDLATPGGHAGLAVGWIATGSPVWSCFDFSVTIQRIHA